MPGLIVALSVQAGRTVKVGEHLLVIEAMKMENVISASHEALVEEVFCSVGDHVITGQKLIQLSS